MVNGIGNSYGEYAAQTLLKGDEINFSRPDPNKMEAMRRATGDRVEISAEARALLKSKMEEYKATSPDDLTSEQKDELKGILSEALGVSEDQLDEMARNMAEGRGRPPKEGPPSQGGRAGKAGGGGAGAETGSTTIADRIETLEQDIEELEEEIEELRGKAARDEDAKEQLKAKEIELSTKQTELAELQGQQSEI